jgi:hypothetical protein
MERPPASASSRSTLCSWPSLQAIKIIINNQKAADHTSVMSWCKQQQPCQLYTFHLVL